MEAVIIIFAVFLIGYLGKALLEKALDKYNAYQYRQYFNLSEYLSQYPCCETKSGIKCFKCGSKSIKPWGIKSPVDKMKIHKCNSCGETLYRTGF
ncbi:hypothetical protein [Photobacterium chitinilyticum]|uniref:hypothetical protein n=1 Tax=Photobacterium chitinilyticum TaxID=2485123 RepID=UPI000FFECF77|nr:hypothetical protein [Photobacterium chitinilyticum]